MATLSRQHTLSATKLFLLPPSNLSSRAVSTGLRPPSVNQAGAIGISPNQSTQALSVEDIEWLLNGPVHWAECFQDAHAKWSSCLNQPWSGGRRKCPDATDLSAIKRAIHHSNTTILNPISLCRADVCAPNAGVNDFSRRVNRFQTLNLKWLYVAQHN